MKALYDYKPLDESHLSFKQDDVIRVFDEHDAGPGFIYGVLDGNRGKIPVETVEEHDAVSGSS